jgi:hypothetical protein
MSAFGGKADMDRANGFIFNATGQRTRKFSCDNLSVAPRSNCNKIPRWPVTCGDVAGIWGNTTWISLKDIWDFRLTTVMGHWKPSYLLR